MATPNTKRDENKDSDDLYITPKVALSSFYDTFPEYFDNFNVYYDPCNGLGDISDWLESIGKKVYRSDIIDYDIEAKVQDFLQVKEIPEDVECIIFNPPFKLTEEFVDKALALCPKLLMFNRMTTIESNSRSKKFKSGEWKLDTMIQFGFRVSCDKGVEREPTANSVAYSWFYFDQEGYAPTKLKWITK